ncbi:MAG: response regulator transcription factor [Deltaproteobacteria bacterium]
MSDDLELNQFGEARNAKEVFENLNEKKWDILILDINLPDMNGLEVLRQVKVVHPELPVLILTILDEDQISVRALKAGASGFMTKNTLPEELMNAVKRIHTGRRYISPSLAEKLVFDIYSEDEKPVHYKLSDREYQVLCLIGSGKSIREIAEELYLSEHTIRTYRMRILEKMNIRTNAELIHYTVQHNLSNSGSV